MDAESPDCRFLAWDPGSEFVRNALGFGTHVLARRQDDGALRLVLGALHCNLNGVAHGGCISTLIDVTLAFRMAELFGSGGVATVNLNLSFLSAARMGDELIVVPRVDRASRRLGFCSASVSCGDRLIATAQATFVPLTR